jgi:hypothetical protein
VLGLTAGGLDWRGDGENVHMRRERARGRRDLGVDGELQVACCTACRKNRRSMVRAKAWASSYCRVEQSGAREGSAVWEHAATPEKQRKPEREGEESESGGGRRE